eukprot:366078-Chlamydomonas_euryale.AAC.7
MFLPGLESTQQFQHCKEMCMFRRRYMSTWELGRGRPAGRRRLRGGPHSAAYLGSASQPACVRTARPPRRTSGPYMQPLSSCQRFELRAATQTFRKSLRCSALIFWRPRFVTRKVCCRAWGRSANGRGSGGRPPLPPPRQLVPLAPDGQESSTPTAMVVGQEPTPDLTHRSVAQRPGVVLAHAPTQRILHGAGAIGRRRRTFRGLCVLCCTRVREAASRCGERTACGHARVPVHPCGQVASWIRLGLPSGTPRPSLADLRPFSTIASRKALALISLIGLCWTMRAMGDSGCRCCCMLASFCSWGRGARTRPWEGAAGRAAARREGICVRIGARGAAAAARFAALRLAAHGTPHMPAPLRVVLDGVSFAKQ